MASVNFYVDPVSGADTNGGSSFGAAKASGTGGATNGTATVDLSADAPNLSAVSVGDTIRLSAEIAGRGASGIRDIFEITAVDDTLDTVTVTPTPGTNAGQTWVIGGSWLTVQKAADTAVGGDEVRLCNTGTETPSAMVDFDTNIGSATSPITFVGADSSGNALDGSGVYTVSGAALPATTDLIFINTANNLYLSFRDVRFTAATRYNIISGANAYFVSFDRCRIDNATSMGVRVQSTGGKWTYLFCEIDSNGSYGLGLNSASRHLANLLGCSVHDNTGDGIHIGGLNSQILGCTIYDNGGDGIDLDGVSYGFIFGNTIFGNTGDGINVTVGGSQSVYYGNSISGNGGYGIDLTGVGGVGYFGYNHYHNNTSGEWSSGSSTEDNKQTGDPLFASTTDGSEDFTPADGSPLDGTGINGLDIGAVGTADPAGGGGGGPLVSGRLVQ